MSSRGGVEMLACGSKGRRIRVWRCNGCVGHQSNRWCRLPPHSSGAMYWMSHAPQVLGAPPTHVWCSERQLTPVFVLVDTPLNQRPVWTRDLMAEITLFNDNGNVQICEWCQREKIEARGQPRDKDIRRKLHGARTRNSLSGSY
jgi:hypothetical protein